MNGMSKIRDRVAKLRAIERRSTFPHEREAAKAKADALEAEYGLANGEFIERRAPLEKPLGMPKVERATYNPSFMWPPKKG